MKCRMKSAAIDCQQFYPDVRPWPKGVREVVRMTPDGDFTAYVIPTPVGQRTVRPGDWVLQGPTGDIMAYSGNQFHELYEIVPD